MPRNKRRRRGVLRTMITNTKASAEQLRARLERGRSGASGVHNDQNHRKDTKRLRRDKTYREDR